MTSLQHARHPSSRRYVPTAPSAFRLALCGRRRWGAGVLLQCQGKSQRQEIGSDRASGDVIMANVRDTDPSPYFEPLMRGFILGAACGGVLEAVTVLQEMAALSGSTNVWPQLVQQFPPHFVQDHVLALVIWMVLYSAESAAQWERSRAVSQKGSLTHKSLLIRAAELPRVLLPLRMTLFRALWLQSPYFQASKHERPRVSPVVYTASSVGTLEEPPLQATEAPVHPPGPESHAPASPVVGEHDTSTPFIPGPAARPGLKPGQWDPGAIGAPAREGIARRVLLQDMWYCVAAVPQGQLPEGKLQEARLAGIAMAYWKDATGAVHAVSSTCTHRGAQLSKGWVDEVDGHSCVRCPYHAWAFSGDGRVRHIPVQPDGRYPRRPLQTSYDIREVDGKVWAYWGNPRLPVEERPPLPGAARFHKEAQPLVVERGCGVPHHVLFEQVSSRAALTMVANRLLGTTGGAVKVIGEPQRAAFSVSQAFELHSSAIVRRTLLGRDVGAKPIYVTVEAQLPSSVVMTFELGDGKRVALEAHVQPVTYDSSVLVMALHQSSPHWWGAKLLIRDELDRLASGHQALAEGRAMAHPVLPLERMHKANKRSALSQLITRFNALRDEFNALGYGVPPEFALNAHRSDM